MRDSLVRLVERKLEQYFSLVFKSVSTENNTKMNGSSAKVMTRRQTTEVGDLIEAVKLKQQHQQQGSSSPR